MFWYFLQKSDPRGNFFSLCKTAHFLIKHCIFSACGDFLFSAPGLRGQNFRRPPDSNYHSIEWEPPSAQPVWGTNGFRRFLLFSHFAQDDRKSSKNVSKMLPESFQDCPKPFQNPPKTPQNFTKALQNCFEMPPRRPLALQGTLNLRPRRVQDAPRLPKTPQDYPKTLPRLLQSSIFEGLGTQKMKSFE